MRRGPSPYPGVCRGDRANEPLVDVERRWLDIVFAASLAAQAAWPVLEAAVA